MSIAILIVEDSKHDLEDIQTSIKIMSKDIAVAVTIDARSSLTPLEIEAWIEAHPGPILLVLDVFQENPQTPDLNELIPDIIAKYLQPNQPSLHKIALLVFTGAPNMKRQERSQAAPPLHYLFKIRRKEDKNEKLRQYLLQSLAYLQE